MASTHWWIIVVATLMSALVDVAMTTACSQPITDIEACLSAIRNAMQDPSAYWFGADYSDRCPGGGADESIDCYHPLPDNGQTIADRLLGQGNFQPSALVRYLNVDFTSPPGQYSGCDHTVTDDSTTTLSIDPMSIETQAPWDVRLVPKLSVEGGAVSGLHTVMVVDAGFRYLQGLYINVDGVDLSTGGTSKAYSGSQNFRDQPNPVAFLLMGQPGPVEISPTELNQLDDPANMDIQAFIDNHNLQGPIAVTWYTSSFDAYSVEAQKQLGRVDNCAAFITPALLAEERPWVEPDTRLSVFSTIEFQAIPYQYTMCCVTHSYGEEPFVIDSLEEKIYDPCEVRTGQPIETLVSQNKIQPDPQLDFQGRYFTMLSVDPDVPASTYDANYLPLVHWLHTDNPITGGRLDFTQGQEILSYIGPNPPAGYPHGYYFLLYEQATPSLGLSSTDDITKYKGAFCGSPRCAFNVSYFVADNSLSLVGASWLYAERSDWSAYTSGTNETVYCQGRPGWVSEDCPLPTTTIPHTSLATHLLAANPLGMAVVVYIIMITALTVY